MEGNKEEYNWEWTGEEASQKLDELLDDIRERKYGELRGIQVSFNFVKKEE